MDLDSLIADKLSGVYNLSSRIHPLQSFPARTYLKRDDELSFGISGNKLRKIASLLPFWKEQGKVVYAIGGASSNHIVACLQVMIEHKIDYRLILLKSAAALSLQGNPAYISLLSDPRRILWLEREQWPDVEKFAEDEARSRDENFLITKEGGAQREAFPGAMTLGQDILRNQAEHGFSFHNIFIDAGTGYSALALKYYLDSVGFPGMLHVVKLAPFDFEKMEKALWDYYGQPKNPVNFKIWDPISAKSFGSVNRSCFDEVKKMARDEGVLLDPIYMAKLSMTARYLIETHCHRDSKNLLIHSGGGLSTHGFWDKILRS